MATEGDSVDRIEIESSNIAVKHQLNKRIYNKEIILLLYYEAAFTDGWMYVLVYSNSN